MQVHWYAGAAHICLCKWLILSYQNNITEYEIKKKMRCNKLLFSVYSYNCHPLQVNLSWLQHTTETSWSISCWENQIIDKQTKNYIIVHTVE